MGVSYRYGRDTLLALGKAAAPCSYLTPHYVNLEVVDVRNNFSLLERGVNQFDARFTLRALRAISSLRKKLSGEIICEAIISTYPPNNPTARTLIRATGVSDDVLSQIAKSVSQELNGTKQEKKEPLPEIDVYIAILIQVCFRSQGGVRLRAQH
jgi:26S proteasome regulatory subunit N3